MYHPVTTACRLGLLTLALAVGARAATAQTTPPAATPADANVYTYVEKMPQLPGGGGTEAIVRAIQQRVTYPASALRAQAQGKVLVKFTVGVDGLVRQISIVQGVHPDLDSVVVRAVRQLPRLEPGMHDGESVAVSCVIPVTFKMTVTNLPPRKRGLFD